MLGLLLPNDAPRRPTPASQPDGASSKIGLALGATKYGSVPLVLVPGYRRVHLPHHLVTARAWCVSVPEANVYATVYVK